MATSVEIFFLDANKIAKKIRIKVSPNTSLIQVLEEACESLGLDAKKYGLRRHNKFLDLGLTIQFSNLPNNATLDLVQALVTREDEKVMVALQTSSDERLIDDFASTTDLWSILSHWQNKGKVNLDDGSVEDVPVVIYMRSEISGEENLKKTTLKSLGIIDGRAVLRMTYRKKDFKMDQAYSTETVIYSPCIKAADVAVQSDRDDVPDSFFGVKKMCCDLQTVRKNLEEQPLETTEPLEARLRPKAIQYSEAIVSIHFPNKMVLQGKFKMDETVADVMKFVANYLSDSSLNFYLYTTPPKAVLKAGLTLMQARLFPKADVLFGTDAAGPNFLKEDILESPEFASAILNSLPVGLIVEDNDLLEEKSSLSDASNDDSPRLILSARRRLLTPTSSGKKQRNCVQWTLFRTHLLECGIETSKEKAKLQTMKEASKFPEFADATPAEIQREFDEMHTLDNERKIRLKKIYSDEMPKCKSAMIDSLLGHEEFVGFGFEPKHFHNKMRHMKYDKDRSKKAPKRKLDDEAQDTEDGTVEKKMKESVTEEKKMEESVTEEKKMEISVTEE